MFSSFSASKLKPQLKMACHRFQIATNKKQAMMQTQKREISKMLDDEPPKEEKAFIKAESLIRDDNTIEAYEIMQLECELLSERIKLISCSKECPPDLVSCVSTLIWASARVDNISELTEIRKLFKAKYGKKFDEAAMNNVGGVLNERVMAKLSIQPPSAYLVQTYLEKIAEEFEVDWKPRNPVAEEGMFQPVPAPDGRTVAAGAGSGYGMTVVTGTDVAYGYGKGGDGGGGGGGGYAVGVPAPPGAGGGMSSAAFPPPGGSVPGAYAMTGQPQGKAGMASAPPPPMAYAQPMDSVRQFQPVAPPPSSNDGGGGDEGDIYVPAAPTGKPMGGGGNRGSGMASGGDAYDEPRDDGESAGGGSAYEDLSARFAQLKK